MGSTQTCATYVVFQSEPPSAYRRAEQLVVYVRALHMLSSALLLAQRNVASHTLHPSPAVQNVLNLLNDKYHQCLVGGQIRLNSSDVDRPNGQKNSHNGSPFGRIVAHHWCVNSIVLICTFTLILYRINRSGMFRLARNVLILPRHF